MSWLLGFDQRESKYYLPDSLEAVGRVVTSDFALLDLVWCITAQKCVQEARTVCLTYELICSRSEGARDSHAGSFTLKTHSSLFLDVVLARWSRKCQFINLMKACFE